MLTVTPSLGVWGMASEDRAPEWGLLGRVRHAIPPSCRDPTGFTACTLASVQKMPAVARLVFSPPHIPANTWNNYHSFAFLVGADLSLGLGPLDTGEAPLPFGLSLRLMSSVLFSFGGPRLFQGTFRGFLCI